MDRAVLVIAAVALATCSAGPTKEPTSTDADVPHPTPAVAPAQGSTKDAGEAEPVAEPVAKPKVPPEAKADIDTEPAVKVAEPKVIRFAWKPRRGPAEAYEMSDPTDQHRLVLTPGVEQGGSYPVVVAFHGQPPRGMAPSGYRFPDDTQKQIVALVRRERIQPVILVIPVFRFIGGNWPWFDLREFRTKMEELFAAEGIAGTDWYAFGHSGAAGCKGDGLNRAHRMRPKAVGYFDTCIGQGWADEIKRLRQRGVRVLNVHSVETAGFVPKQTPEYQSTFDFGRAYKPAGMKPVDCPKNHPGVRLRDQKYRCAASKDGLLKAFVIDSGQGKEAHRNVLVPAIRYFLVDFVRLGRKG
jgi:hypothetical protein